MITRKKLTEFPKARLAIDKEDEITLNRTDIERISRPWAAFMGSGNYTMQRMHIRGDIRKLKTDLVAR